MDNYLLIGNGLNRCIPNGVSWNNLLENISKDYNVNYNTHITMPLEFERMVNEYLERERNNIVVPGRVLNQFKEKVAKLIQVVSLPNNAIHRELEELDINGIMTTNYDILLEKVYDNSYKYNGGKTQKYLFDKTCQIDNKSFYHIHGIADKPSTLCLGFEHYMGIVENLRRDINTKKNGDSYQMNIKRVLCGEEDLSGEWGELFYTSNIAIIGLGLTECESDLWWIITHRASIYYSDYCKLRSRDILKNKIVFYDVLDEEIRDNDTDENIRQSNEIAKKNRHILLKNEHVEVRTFTIGKECQDYQEAYHLIIEDIKSKGIE